MNRILLASVLAVLVGCANNNPTDESASTAGAATTIAPDEPCHTDGCVMRKHDQLAGVLAWVHDNDDCTSVVAWTQQVSLVGHQTYSVICGDSEATEYLLRAEGGGAEKVTVTELSAKTAKAITIDHCHTDGCVMRKLAAFDAAVEWTKANDQGQEACSSVVSWVQSISEAPNGQYLVKCGDTSEAETFTLDTSTTDDGKTTATLAPKPRN